ncbi:MAG: porin family protein [Bacteroidales bacterium]|nr:porin family protein [Bacteroidales bacterium]
MKKLFLFFGAALISISVVNAQTSFGIKAGGNISSVSNLESSSTTAGATSVTQSNKIKPGFNVGVFLNVRFGDFLGFQPEVLYTTKGYKYESKVVIGAFETKTTLDATLNYIEIPMQLRLNITENFYILGGPYVGILAGAMGKTTTYVSTPPVTTESKSTSTDGIEKMDLGLSVGTCFLSEGGFNFGVKYSRGFTDAFENSTGNTNSNVNSVFQLFIGFSFGGKK